MLGPDDGLASGLSRISGEGIDHFSGSIFLRRQARGEISLDGWATPGIVQPLDDREDLPCFVPEGDTVEDFPEIGKVREAALFLIAKYRFESDKGFPEADLTTIASTGTIVRAEEGVNRVLTAAHGVLLHIFDETGARGELESIHAFDADGRLMARLAPVHVPAGRHALDALPGDFVHDDIAVLAPEVFASPGIASAWADRGLEVSPVQSASLLFVHGEAGVSTITFGHSGAALIDGDARILGVVAETASIPSSLRRAPNTVMPEAILMDDLSMMTPLEIEATLSVAMAPPEGVYVDSVSIGTPVSDPGILASLGVDPGRISMVSTFREMELFTAGFPEYECRMSRLFLEPVPEAGHMHKPGFSVAFDLPDAKVHVAGGAADLVMGDDEAPARSPVSYWMTVAPHGIPDFRIGSEPAPDDEDAGPAP